MPFEVKGDEPLDAVVNVRLTTAEKNRLREDADLAGITMADLVRRSYLGKPIGAKLNLVLVKELRRIGGLLKVLQREEDRGSDSALVSVALRDLRSCLEKISHDR